MSLRIKLERRRGEEAAHKSRFEHIRAGEARRARPNTFRNRESRVVAEDKSVVSPR